MRIAHVTKQTGISLIEILVAGLVMGTAIVGVSLMYGTGRSWVSATGEGRVATGLAQEMIEQLRTQGWACVIETATSPPCKIGLPSAGAPKMEAAVYPAGVVDLNARAFTRATCIQYVDDAGMNTPAYTPDCPAGDPTNTVRITVTVTSTRAIEQANPVTLQAWVIKEGA